MEVKEQNTEKIATVKFITDKLFGDAKRWKFFYAGSNQDRWIDDIKFVKGYQWPSERPQSKTSTVENKAWAIIQRELPFMTDNKPKIYVEYSEPSDKTWAEVIQQIIETGWTQRNMEMKLPEGTLHAKEVGIGYYRPFWNTKLAGGLGDFDCETVDPLEIFPLAYTEELTMERCEGIIWARNVSLGWVKKNYPTEGWRVKSQIDPAIRDRAKETNKTGKNEPVQVTDMDTGTAADGTQTYYLPGGEGSMTGADTQRVTLFKAFLRDSSTKDYDKEEEKKDKSAELKYPNGRMITIAGGIVLEDEAWPFEFFPIIDQKNYILPGEFWGESDVNQIKALNQALNKQRSALVDATRRGTYTTKFLTKGSGIDVETYVDSEDALYETNIPNPVSVVQNQNLPLQAFELATQLDNTVDKIAGSMDYSPPQAGNLPSGRSLAEFNEMNQVRIRQKLRNLDNAVKRIGSAWMEMILKNYTEQRVMRLLNPQTNKGEFVFIFKEADPNKAQVIREQAEAEIIPGTEQIDPKTQQAIKGSGQPKYKQVLNMAEIKGTFDLNVATSSTVSVSKYATFGQAMALYQGGIIDRVAVLEAADYPNRDEILKRMEQKERQMMMAQQQATQIQAQKDMAKNQTTLQKTNMDNQTDVFIEKLKLGGSILMGGQNAVNKERAQGS